MARPYKNVPGRRFSLSYYGDTIEVTGTYRCPYCEQETTASFEAYSSQADTLEESCFSSNMQCEYCGRKADVRFMHNTKC